MAFLRQALLLIVVLVLAGCVFSPAGSAYVRTKAWGDEKDIIGVVTGLWEYDEEQNLKRLRKYLPKEDDQILRSIANRYQVRVTFSDWWISGITTEVAILPKGWSYTTSNDAVEKTVVQPGDLVVVSGRNGRFVDYVKSIERRCDGVKKAGEKRAWSVDCFEVDEFGKGGYGGK